MAEELLNGLTNLLILFEERKKIHQLTTKSWGPKKPLFVKEWVVYPNYKSMVEISFKIEELCECLNLFYPSVIENVDKVGAKETLVLIKSNILEQINSSSISVNELFKCPDLPSVSTRIKDQLEKANIEIA